jgi:molecular chaperone DnaJ
MSSTNDGGDSLYDTLGVGTDATEAEITRAYRRLAREHHPDANPAGSDEGFSELTDAYDVLRDQERRRAYDDARRGRARAAKAAAAGVRIPVRHASQSTQPRANSQGAGAGARSPRQSGREVELHLSFDQAPLGTTAVLSVEDEQPCTECAGTGAGPASDSRCADCHGTGTITRRSGGITIRTECLRCGSAGRVRPDDCPTCSGSGRQRCIRDVSVRVPAGVDTGVRLRVRLSAGTDVIAVVRVRPHPYFTREGTDLHVRVPVTIAEASLGGVVTVPTLDSAVAIRLPAGTPHGRTLRVKGKGVARADSMGDLLVTIDVVIPTELNQTQRAALEAFAAATESPRRHLEWLEHAKPPAGDCT